MLEVNEEVLKESDSITVKDELLQEDVLYYSFNGEGLTIYLDDVKQKDSSVLMFNYVVGKEHEINVTDGSESLLFKVVVEEKEEKDAFKGFSAFNRYGKSIDVIEDLENVLSKNKILKDEGFELNGSDDCIRVDFVSEMGSGTKTEKQEEVRLAVQVFTKRFNKMNHVMNQVVKTIEKLHLFMKKKRYTIERSEVEDVSYNKSFEDGEWEHQMTFICSISVS